VVVHDLDAFGASRSPAKTDAVLIVDPDAVLAGTIAFECLEPIPGRNPQVVEPAGDLELSELASSDRLDTDESPNPRSAGKSFSVGISERDDHDVNSNAARA